jgi:hypothetical protein
MLAQYQMMGARAQQQQLAQQQLEEYERARQEDEMVRQYYMQPGRGALNQPNLTGLAQVSPSTFIKAMPAYTGAMENLERTKYIQEQIASERGLRPLKEMEVRGKGREAGAKATKEEAGLGSDLLRTAYLGHRPDVPGSFEKAYAKIYPELPEAIQNKLGPRPNPSDLEPYLVSKEEFTERRKPRPVKADEMIVTGSGLEGDFYRTQPTYRPPNAMVTNQPALNTFATQGRMPPSVDQMDAPLSPQERIIKRDLTRRTLLNQVPPEDRPRVESQLDLYETIKAANAGFDRLATAGGIPVAGQTTAKNWQAKLKTSGAGLALGNMSDTQVAEEYNNLRTISGVIRQRFAGAIGLTARQMDAAKEAEALEKILGTNPTAEGLASAKRRLNTINELLGTGETSAFESPRPSRGKAGESTPKPLKGDETIDFGDMP